LDKIKKPGPKAVHLLSGYITCSCSKKMYVYHKDKTPHYRCKECNTKIQVSDIDEIYHEQLKDFLLTDIDITDYLKQSDCRLQEKEQLLKKTQADISRIRKEIKELVDLRLKAELTTETLAPLLKPLEAQVQELEHGLPELEAEVDFLKIEYLSSETVLEGAKDLYHNWSMIDFEEKRSIVEMITSQITIGKSNINICLSYLPSPRLAQNVGKRPRSAHNLDPA
jgi:site-specific DNA recombinase